MPCRHRDEIFDSEGNLLPGINIISGPHDVCSECYPKYLITGTADDPDGHPDVDGTYVYYGDYIGGCVGSTDPIDKKIIFSNGTYYMFSDEPIFGGDCMDWIISDVLPDALLRDAGVIEEQSSILYWAMDGGSADDSLWYIGHTGGYYDINGIYVQKI